MYFFIFRSGFILNKLINNILKIQTYHITKNIIGDEDKEEKKRRRRRLEENTSDIQTSYKGISSFVLYILK